MAKNRNSGRVYTFAPGKNKVTGDRGWRPESIPDFDPVPPLMVVHDIMEHVPGREGGVENEYIAQGGMAWLRYNGGFFDDQVPRRNVVGVAQLIVPPAFGMLFGHIVRSNLKTLPAPITADAHQPLDGQTESLIAALIAVGSQHIHDKYPGATGKLLESLSHAAGWMRIGYRLTAKRYDGRRPVDMATMFKKIVERVTQLTAGVPSIEYDAGASSFRLSLSISSDLMSFDAGLGIGSHTAPTFTRKKLSLPDVKLLPGERLIDTGHGIAKLSTSTQPLDDVIAVAWLTEVEDNGVIKNDPAKGRWFYPDDKKHDRPDGQWAYHVAIRTSDPIFSSTATSRFWILRSIQPAVKTKRILKVKEPSKPERRSVQTKYGLALVFGSHERPPVEDIIMASWNTDSTDERRMWFTPGARSADVPAEATTMNAILNDFLFVNNDESGVALYLLRSVRDAGTDVITIPFGRGRLVQRDGVRPSVEDVIAARWIYDDESLADGRGPWWYPSGNPKTDEIFKRISDEKGVSTASRTDNLFDGTRKLPRSAFYLLRSLNGGLVVEKSSADDLLPKDRVVKIDGQIPDGVIGAFSSYQNAHERTAELEKLTKMNHEQLEAATKDWPRAAASDSAVIGGHDKKIIVLPRKTLGIAVGSRVVRGPDWKWANFQDGNGTKVGIVTAKLTANDGFVWTAKWNGAAGGFSYRDAPGERDLIAIAPPAQPEKLAVGDRVIRGPKWDDDDGNVDGGRAGIVTKVDADVKHNVYVRWEASDVSTWHTYTNSSKHLTFVSHGKLFEEQESVEDEEDEEEEDEDDDRPF